MENLKAEKFQNETLLKRESESNRKIMIEKMRTESELKSERKEYRSEIKNKQMNLFQAKNRIDMLIAENLSLKDKIRRMNIEEKDTKKNHESEIQYISDKALIRIRELEELLRTRENQSYFERDQSSNKKSQKQQGYYQHQQRQSQDWTHEKSIQSKKNQASNQNRRQRRPISNCVLNDITHQVKDNRGLQINQHILNLDSSQLSDDIDFFLERKSRAKEQIGQLETSLIADHEFNDLEDQENRLRSLLDNLDQVSEQNEALKEQMKEYQQLITEYESVLLGAKDTLGKFKNVKGGIENLVQGLNEFFNKLDTSLDKAQQSGKNSAQKELKDNIKELKDKIAIIKYRCQESEIDFIYSSIADLNPRGGSSNNHKNEIKVNKFTLDQEASYRDTNHNPNANNNNELIKNSVWAISDSCDIGSTNSEVANHNRKLLFDGVISEKTFPSKLSSTSEDEEMIKEKGLGGNLSNFIDDFPSKIRDRFPEDSMVHAQKNASEMLINQSQACSRYGKECDKIPYEDLDIISLIRKLKKRSMTKGKAIKFLKSYIVDMYTQFSKVVDGLGSQDPVKLGEDYSEDSPTFELTLPFQNDSFSNLPLKLSTGIDTIKFNMCKSYLDGCKRVLKVVSQSFVDCFTHQDLGKLDEYFCDLETFSATNLHKMGSYLDTVDDIVELLVTKGDLASADPSFVSLGLPKIQAPSQEERDKLFKLTGPVLNDSENSTIAIEDVFDFFIDNLESLKMRRSMDSDILLNSQTISSKTEANSKNMDSFQKISSGLKKEISVFSNAIKELKTASGHQGEISDLSRLNEAQMKKGVYLLNKVAQEMQRYFNSCYSYGAELDTLSIKGTSRVQGIRSLDGLSKQKLQTPTFIQELMMKSLYSEINLMKIQLELVVASKPAQRNDRFQLICDTKERLGK